MIAALTTVLIIIHALIAATMLWIGLTVPKSSMALLTAWFCVSLLTVATLARLGS